MGIMPYYAERKWVLIAPYLGFMPYYVERKWVLIDPVTAVYYIRNASPVGRGPRC